MEKTGFIECVVVVCGVVIMTIIIRSNVIIMISINSIIHMATTIIIISTLIRIVFIKPLRDYMHVRVVLVASSAASVVLFRPCSVCVCVWGGGRRGMSVCVLMCVYVWVDKIEMGKTNEGKINQRSDQNQQKMNSNPLSFYHIITYFRIHIQYYSNYKTILN